MERVGTPIFLQLSPRPWNMTEPEPNLGTERRKKKKSLLIKNDTAAAAVMGIVVVIATAIAIVIGYIVLVQVVNNVPSNTLNSAQSTQLANIQSQLANSFTLTTVLPVVLVASLIIGGFLTFFTFSRPAKG